MTPEYISELRLTLPLGQTNHWEKFSKICKKHGGRYSSSCGLRERKIMGGYVWLTSERAKVEACIHELESENFDAL